MSKWATEEPQFCEYFRSEWVRKHPNWFAAANLNAPNTNNSLEGFNSSIKKNHTMRRQLPITIFKETLLKLIQHKSNMYVREKEKKIFYDAPKIAVDEWKRGAEYAMDAKTKEKVFQYGDVYYILSNAELNESRVANSKAAVDLFNSVEATTFNEYLENYHQRVYELKYETNWRSSSCSCPYFMANPICKHIISIALLKRDALCPIEANPNILGRKPKRGPKSKAKGALHKPIVV